MTDRRRMDSGLRFGRLVAIRRVKSSMWLFRCDCGVEVERAQYYVWSGNTQSCGCLKSITVLARNAKHGLMGHPLYHLWNGMKTRCQPNGPASHGKRGIRVCERWLLFENFVADMGPRPPGMTLDREDNDKDYGPDNCRWATRREQAENTSRNVRLTIGGETLTMSQWARKLGIDQRTLNNRRRRGWTDEAVILTPLRK